MFDRQVLSGLRFGLRIRLRDMVKKTLSLPLRSSALAIVF